MSFFSLSWFRSVKTRSVTNDRQRRIERFRGIETLEKREVLAAAILRNELLVEYLPEATELQRSSARSAVVGQLQQTIYTAAMRNNGYGALETIAIPANLDVQSAMNAIKNRPGVASVELNQRVGKTVANDPRYTNGSLWGMYSDDSPSLAGPSGTTNSFGSQAEEAWAAGATGSRNVVVGIIDEGVDFNHPDLINNMWVNPFDPLDGIDNDGNGYVDDTRGWDFYNNDNSIFDAAQGDTHGTHVAGTIGAQGNNGVGVTGVNWNVTMISTKFLGPDGGYTSDAVRALDYLTDLKTRHGINIVATNNSWGGGGYSSALHSAILRAAKAGILFVGAAGNEALNNDTTPSYPSNTSTLTGTSAVSAASYEAVIAVASITNTGALSSFSNYGATQVDIGAPGSSILSTVPGGAYASYSGTSMATPHVTGAIALYAAANPGATAAQIRSALLSTATPTTSLAGRTVTGGRLNVSAMLNIRPGVNVNISDAALVEGNSGTSQLQFTVSLSSASTSAVSVNYATANSSATAGSDYTAVAGTVTFNPGETSKVVTVGILGDTTVEANESFLVNLSGVVGNATIADGQGIGTITNDDVSPVLGLAINDVTVNENAGTAVFTVSLSQASTSNVSVRFTTANGSARNGRDYLGASGTVTFAPGQLTRTITVTLYDDRLVEANETFFVRLSRATGATITDSSGTATIVDNEATGTARSYLNSLAANANDDFQAMFYFAVEEFFRELGSRRR
jgi:subtilisin family serine protease